MLAPVAETPADFVHELITCLPPPHGAIQTQMQKLEHSRAAGKGVPRATVARAVDRPVNVVVGFQGPQPSLAGLSALGVKRISLGSALSRTALGSFIRAAREMKEKGSFEFSADAVSFGDISAMLKG